MFFNYQINVYIISNNRGLFVKYSLVWSCEMMIASMIKLVNGRNLGENVIINLQISAREVITANLFWQE